MLKEQTNSIRIKSKMYIFSHYISEIRICLTTNKKTFCCILIVLRSLTQNNKEDSKLK